jgi:hypothetical protein
VRKLAKDEKPSVQPRKPASADWLKSNATMLSGQSWVDEMDLVAREMELRWGADRLRTLVAPEMREKLDRQRYLVNQAIWHGDLEAVKRETQRMIKAWHACSRAAEQAGKEPLTAHVWEIGLDDGRVLALCRTTDDALAYSAGGRKAVVWTLDEVAHMISGELFVSEVKRQFEGATVVAARRTIQDPLKAVADSKEPLDDPIAF